jgi:NAD(P)H-dependent FMN reductase
MSTLLVVIASTRPGRAGEPVARWFHQRAAAHGGFEPELVDLREVGLPAMDEPNHPRLGQYTKQHTRVWSEHVQRADAFAFVTPEYNHGPAPALVNALAFLHAEWAYKPAGLVSYGGVSAGTRGAEMTKQIITTLKMVTPPEAVHIPFVANFIVDGALVANAEMAAGATALLDELRSSSDALASLRAVASTSSRERAS